MVSSRVLQRWKNAEDTRGNGSSGGGDALAPSSSAGPSNGGGGGGRGGADVQPEAPLPPLAPSPPPLRAPGGPQPRADDEDADGGPDDMDDLREDKIPLSALFHSNRIFQKKIKDEGTDLWEDGHDKESLSDLVQEHSDRIIQIKIKILGQRYTHFRRTRGHSNCFYRAFLFSYLENLGQLQDRQAEVTRLMQHVAKLKDPFCGLIWDTATENFSNPEVFFTTFKNEFNTMVDSVANGLSSDERFKSCVKAMRSLRSSRIIFFLRVLAETDIRTRGEEYASLHPEYFDVIPYCCKVVRPMNAQANVLAARALTYALGIPLRVETVDGDLTDQIAKVKCLDFIPRSEAGKGPYAVVMSNWSSSDRTPLLTLMCVLDPRRWYILYG